MAKDRRKNVLLIAVDQWSGAYLSCAGHQEIMTPSLDELANYGIRYCNAVSNTPVCIPARREMLLGVSSKIHGDRIFNTKLPMPEDLPSLAQVFRNHGYQAYCTGKLHVYPQRNRVGFDDVHLIEEGRHSDGMRQDDYERYLARRGFAGMEFAHGMNNNNYLSRSFHLPENCHPTNWATLDMCDTILRRDTTRPAFWYLSYISPHPPLVPLHEYMEMYEDIEFSQPQAGDWTRDEDLPFAYSYYKNLYKIDTKRKLDIAKRAYYALCTHIDHQIRLVIGTLREAGILEDTLILFAADHGEMLGMHNLWGKFLMYENSVKVPMILVPTVDSGLPCGVVDNRLVELKDIMPTLLQLAGIEVPEYAEGISMVDPVHQRDYSYGELWEDDRATRMILTKSHKLIYYPVGNFLQLFDLRQDPGELHNVIDDPVYENERKHLEMLLIQNLYGGDERFVEDGQLVGLPKKEYAYFASLQDNNKLFQGRDMLLQRGIR